ncbi:MAG TPA: hypothetical protein VHC22_28685 [Pirellulales bacterium]|nr:hypothetical protein [Pirellulales bacterium]
MPPRLQIGTIILADVNEPGGIPAGQHPAVIVSPQEEIDAGEELAVVVCSTNFSLPLQAGWFSIPTMPGPDGHPVTGLNEACVAKATWPDVVLKSDIKRVFGRVPMSICRQIVNWLAEENAKRLRKQRERS